MGKDRRRRERKKHLELITRLKEGARVEHGEDDVHTVNHVFLGKDGWSYMTHCGLGKSFPRRTTKGLKLTRRPSSCVVCLGTH